MAANFDPITSYRSIRTLSPTTVIEIEYVVARTLPTGFGFAYPLPLELWQTDAGDAHLSGIAAQLEELGKDHHVVSCSPNQDTDASDQLADFVSATVRYSRASLGLPPLEGTVDIPMGTLDFMLNDLPVPPGMLTPSQIVDAEYDRLTVLAQG